MWQLVYESGQLQRRLVAMFIESSKTNNMDMFNRLYFLIKRNSERWNRRFDKAAGV